MKQKDIFEQIRLSRVEIEQLEAALCESLAYKEKFPKDQVICDILISKLVNDIQEKSEQIIQIYDNDKQLQDQRSEMATPVDQWTNLDMRILEIKHEDQILGQQTEPQSMFDRYVLQTIKQCEVLFTSEECNGKYLDLNKQYIDFKNIKSLQLLDLSLPQDYLSWLQVFPTLIASIPLNIKEDPKYGEYLLGLVKQMTEFYKKSNPLVNFKTEVEQSFESTFNEEWSTHSLYGWESVLKRMANQSPGDELSTLEQGPLFCQACNKTFSNENVFENHKKGKKHLKASSGKIVEFSESRILKLKTTAYLETWAVKLSSLMSEKIVATQNQVRKKQSSSYQEIVSDQKQNRAAAFGKDVDVDMENQTKKVENTETKNLYLNSDSDEEDKIAYNPKNLPIGWDGKPIPFWLYKLHGLGVEYKCEICGGASYWGQQAFEKHFQQWRHAYGMKCLKIPNTVHFHNVTDIEQALLLHKKILNNNYQSTFKPDYEEEFEDQDGNVLPRKVYIDMKRQGII